MVEALANVVGRFVGVNENGAALEGFTSPARLPERGDGIRIVSQPSQHDSQIVMSRGVVFAECDGRTKAVDRVAVFFPPGRIGSALEFSLSCGGGPQPSGSPGPPRQSGFELAGN